MNRFSKTPPLWISHRGYCRPWTENTRQSFAAAVELGFKALETDLRLTKDGHIILAHDPDLYRLAGDRRSIAGLTRRETAAIRLAGGEPLLFLDQFLEAFPELSWTFDIKPETGEKTIDALGKWAETNHMTARITRQAAFLTWRPGHEALVQDHFPGARFYARPDECKRAGLAVLMGLPWLGDIRPGRIYALPPSYRSRPLFTPAIIGRYQIRHARVTAFLPETIDQAQAAIAAGCDEILTNKTIVPAA